MKTQFSAFVAASLLLLSGCKKDADLLECNLPVKPTKSLASFTTEYSVPTQTFSFDATQLQTLTTSAGASVRVPANAFQLPSGAPVSGTIELRVREIYTPGEYGCCKLSLSDFQSALNGSCTCYCPGKECC